MTVGGGTRVYGAQGWRFFPDDFRMATRYGVPDGSSLADWPISYDDLAPYYERAEWEIGVAGAAGAHPAAAGARARDYPLPAVATTLEWGVLARGAAALGWPAGPVPLLINTVPRGGRADCVQCGQCVGFSCPTDAKNGAHNTVIPRALATGRCALVTSCVAERVETDASGRVDGRAAGRRLGRAPKRARRARSGRRRRDRERAVVPRQSQRRASRRSSAMRTTKWVATSRVISTSGPSAGSTTRCTTGSAPAPQSRRPRSCTATRAWSAAGCSPTSS